MVISGDDKMTFPTMMLGGVGVISVQAMAFPKLFSHMINSCLDGITRKTIISLAKELNINFEERKIKLEEVFESDEAFFTGTAAEVVPINSLDNKSIANGLRGPITEKLQKAYLDQVRGKRTENQDWHTPINS